jgi:hypothetical protein
MGNKNGLEGAGQIDNKISRLEVIALITPVPVCTTKFKNEKIVKMSYPRHTTSRRYFP